MDVSQFFYFGIDRNHRLRGGESGRHEETPSDNLLMSLMFEMMCAWELFSESGIRKVGKFRS